MIWIVWRQHRITIALTVVLAIALIALVIAQREGGVFYSARGIMDYIPIDSLLPYTPGVLGVAVAVFWAAPLISREYENRTHVVVWGQDMSPLRWLTGKVALLAAVAVALSVIVASITTSGVDLYSTGSLSKGEFETNPILQALYTLFGFALGLAFSALLRRTLPAMGATLVLFLAVRAVVAWALFAKIIPPVRSAREWGPPDALYAPDVPREAWTVGAGYADVSGAPISIPSSEIARCELPGTRAAYVECMKGKGAWGHFTDYHPHSRLPWFYAIEIGVFAVLTAVLLVLVFRWVGKVSGKSFPGKPLHRPHASLYTA